MLTIIGNGDAADMNSYGGATHHVVKKDEKGWAVHSSHTSINEASKSLKKINPYGDVSKAKIEPASAGKLVQPGNRWQPHQAEAKDTPYRKPRPV